VTCADGLAPAQAEGSSVQPRPHPFHDSLPQRVFLGKVAKQGALRQIHVPSDDRSGDITGILGASQRNCRLNSDGAALIGRDRTIPIGICGRQALKALADELGLAEAAIAIGIGTHGAGRSLLGGRSTGRGQQKRGEAAGE
jgi:hypothetical protein